MKHLFTVAGLLLGMLATAASACQFNTDCAPGSRCVKNGVYGVCAGGLNPGNTNDRQPVYSPTDPNRTVGNTCRFDTDCGPGNQCGKNPGYINGVCVRR